MFHELPRVKKPTHLHVCACGNILICHSPDDDCPLWPAHYVCHVCEDRALDAWIEKQAAEAAAEDYNAEHAEEL